MEAVLAHYYRLRKQNGTCRVLGMADQHQRHSHLLDHGQNKVNYLSHLRLIVAARRKERKMAHTKEHSTVYCNPPSLAKVPVTHHQPSRVCHNP